RGCGEATARSSGSCVLYGQAVRRKVLRVQRPARGSRQSPAGGSRGSLGGRHSSRRLRAVGFIVFGFTPEARTAAMGCESQTMTADLELTILCQGQQAGFVSGFAITDQMIVAAGGTSKRGPVVLASSNARHFEPRKTPRELGLRSVLAVGEVLWTCGEFGQL